MPKPSHWRRIQGRAALLLCTVFILAAAVYTPGLNGPFLLDDRQNIVFNSAIQIDSLRLTHLAPILQGNESGPLGRPVAFISFAISHAISGLSPTAFKLGNLVIHLLCGVLVYLISRLLHSSISTADALANDRKATLASRQFAGLITALWLLHPIHVSTVLYAVQRMTILAALFDLIGLWAYLRMRRTQLAETTWGGRWLPLILAAWVLATFSKENGALLPLYCLLAEVCLFHFRAQSPALQKSLRRLTVTALLGLTFALLWHFESLWHTLTSGYSARAFTLDERLWTQTRILVFYLSLILLPRNGAFSLYHDDIAVSQGWLAPFTTLPSSLLLVALLCSAFALRRTRPLYSFGVGLFFAGHLLESTLIPLELAFEHRNYLPSIGAIIAACALLEKLAPAQVRRSWLIAGAAIAILASLTLARSLRFGDEYALVQHHLIHHPNSVRTQLWTGDTLKRLALLGPAENSTPTMQVAMQHYQRASKLDPNDTIGLFERLEWQYQATQAIDQTVVDELRQRLLKAYIVPGTINAMVDHLDTVQLRIENFPLELPESMATALLSNPRLHGTAKTLTLEARAKYRWRELNWSEAAVTDLLHATRISPRAARLWALLARMQLYCGNGPASRESIKAAMGTAKPQMRRELETLVAEPLPPEPRDCGRYSAAR